MTPLEVQTSLYICVASQMQAVGTGTIYVHEWHLHLIQFAK